MNETLERLFRSSNLAVRVRAAAVLLGDAELPLAVLLEILDRLHDQGLGASAERVLLRRNDPEMPSEMIRRLQSPAPFVREVACNVLGKKAGRAATEYLVASLRDPSLMVRRAAGFALAEAKDPAAVEPLLECYRESAADDIIVRFAIECALRALRVEFDRHVP